MKKKIRIRDGKFGSGTNIPDPQHCSSYLGLESWERFSDQASRASPPSATCGRVANKKTEKTQRKCLSKNVFFMGFLNF
jgi:hypothetical protein